MTTPSTAVRAVLDPWHAAPIAPVLHQRRSALLAGLDGEVLVVSGPPAVLPPPGPARVDHVVSVGWLGASDDLDHAIASILERLEPGGWLHAIEPTTGVPSLARMQRLSAPVGHLRTGWHLGRDLPAALRRSGLVLTDLDRFSMPVASRVLQPWVEVRARRRDERGSVGS